jgi:small-conductance mechanosensitive channel
MSFEVSSFTLIAIAVSGAMVFLGLRAVRWLMSVVPATRARRKKLLRFMPILETAAVVGFLLVAIPVLVGGDPELSPVALVVVLALVAGVSWSSLRDFASGVVFRASSPCDVDDHVRIGDVEGRVTRIGYRSVEIETEAGEHAYIPMSRAARDNIHRAQRVERVMHRFRVHIPEGMSTPEARERARRAALLSHWSSVSRTPEVLEVSSTELDIKVYALAPNRAGEIEALVRRALGARR